MQYNNWRKSKNHWSFFFWKWKYVYLKDVLLSLDAGNTENLLEDKQEDLSLSQT